MVGIGLLLDVSELLCIFRDCLDYVRCPSLPTWRSDAQSHQKFSTRTCDSSLPTGQQTAPWISSFRLVAYPCCRYFCTVPWVFYSKGRKEGWRSCFQIRGIHRKLILGSMEASSKQTRLRKNAIGSFHLKSPQKIKTCHLTLSHFAGLLGVKTIIFQFLERWDQWFPRYSPPKFSNFDQNRHYRQYSNDSISVTNWSILMK